MIGPRDVKRTIAAIAARNGASTISSSAETTRSNVRLTK